MHSILPIGGRVKSSALGLDTLFTSQDPMEVTQHIQTLRKNPTNALKMAYFPAIDDTLKQRLRDVGIYRPVLKTDQGMPGNFLSFRIDANREADSFHTARIIHEAGIAIPEPHADLNEETVLEIQKYFHNLQLGKVFSLLPSMQRTAEKGRAPFFFIRAAETEEPLVLGQQTLQRVEAEVQRVLNAMSERAQELEEAYRRQHHLPLQYAGDNLLYCQPDVFVLHDQVQVEKINCPDVGLFLTELETGNRSKAFGKVRTTVQEMMAPLLQKLADRFPNGVAIVTRDEVLENKEDLLEINEILALTKGLQQHGVKAQVYSLSTLHKISKGQPALLLNIDYKHPAAENLLEQHARQQLECYPNPFFQQAAKEVTGLKTATLEGKYLDKFMNIIRGIPDLHKPKAEQAVSDIYRRIEECLGHCTMTENILHADLGHEVVPYLRPSLHASRMLYTRASRQPSQKMILRALPATHENLRITSDSGPRLHTFRFMCLED